MNEFISLPIMKSKFAAVMVVMMVLAGVFAFARMRHAEARTAQPQAGAESKPGPRLPSPPAGVTELKFSDFFVAPVGPRGLEFTKKLRDLDGKRVRILGYMVQQENALPGAFILSPYPAQIHDHDNALADSLPPAVVHVTVPTNPDKPVPFSPRLLLLTGTLSVGNKTEPDGRMSRVRLAADAPATVTNPGGLPLSSLANKSNNSSRKGY
jgi:hypothetical protein